VLLRPPTYSIGGASAALPIDPEDILWFGRAMEAKGVKLNARLSAGIRAARDLGIMAFVTSGLASRMPPTVRVEAGPLPGIDIAAATAACSLIHTLRYAESNKPKLFEACWKVVFEGVPFAIPQRQSPERDHVWEFLNAASYSEFGDGVDINMSDEGADVRGKFRRCQWGIECKVFYSTNVSHHIDRIIEGAKQLENDVQVEKGVVAVNVTNCIDHTAFQRSLIDGSTFRTTDSARDALAATVREIAIETSTPAFQRRFAADKNGKLRLKCRAVLYIGQTVALAGGRVEVFTSQVSLLRKPSEVSDRVFANRYHLGWRAGVMMPSVTK
jgi:hypothetical protein